MKFDFSFIEKLFNLYYLIVYKRCEFILKDVSVNLSYVFICDRNLHGI